MRLSEKQKKFTRCVSTLLDFIHTRGYEITFGDAFRHPILHGHVGVKKAYGHKNSCHKLKLAIDLNLFKDGVYLTETNDHQAIGIFWESLDPLCRWGGRFNDGNHYSFEHNGAM